MKKLLAALLLAALLIPAAAWADCDHDFYMANVTKPSCESEGYYILKCHLCGYQKKEITDSAWGHSWELTASREPSCDEKGYRKYTCSTCHKTKTDNLSETGHVWKDSHVLEAATCTRDGSMRTVCEVCGLSGVRKISKGHSYGEWNVTEEATDHTKGTRTRTCRSCRKTQTETYYPEGTLYKDIKGHSDEIKDLQQKLTDLEYLNDKVDGKFGKKTQAAVKAFQREHGLNADGIAWPQTLRALEETVYGGILADGRGDTEYCAMTILEDGTISWEVCDTHLAYEMQATAGLSPEAGAAERLGCRIVAWQAEVDVLYQTWLELCPPQEQPMVINHKAMFLGYLNSQQMLWNAQFGEGSAQALEMVNSMLMEQCYTLCPIVDALQNAE